MVRQTARLVFFEIVGGILFLAVIAAAFFAWRLSQGPMELGAFSDDVAAALTEARDGREVTVATVQLEWSPERRRVDVAAEDLVFYSATGQASGRAERAHIELDASALLLGEVEIVSMMLSGGGLTVEQITPDVWSVGGEPLPPIPQGAAPQNPAEWIDLLNRVLSDLLGSGGTIIDGLRLESIGFEDLTVDFELSTGERLIRLADTGGILERRGNDLNFEISARGEGDGVPGGISLGMASTESFSGIRIDLGIRDWTLAEFGERLGASEGRFSGLPADIALTLIGGRVDGLQRLDAEIDTGAGAIAIAGNPVPVSRLDGAASYRTDSDRLDFYFDIVDAGVVRGEMSGTLDGAAYAEEERRFTFAAPDLRVDATPFFERPWRLRSVEVDAVVAPDLHALQLDQARIGIGDAVVRLNGALRRNLEPADGDLPFTAELVAEMDGRASPRDVLDFWPVQLGRGARNFVRDRVESGLLTTATARLDLDADSFRQGFLEDDALSVDFSATGVDVRFLSDVPPVTDAAGTGRLTGNSFSVRLVRAAWQSWDIASGSVELPQMNPKGGDMAIIADGTGPIAEAVGAVFRSRLDLEEQTGFDPDRLSGTGEVRFEMHRPALSNVPLEDMTISVTGRARDAGVVDAAGGLDLTESSARVDFDLSRLTVSGFGRLGPAEVTFDWRDQFGDDGAPSELAARSVVTPDILNRFGFLGRPFIVGDVPAEMTATIDGETVLTSSVELDLTTARIDLAEIGWLKPSGVAARAHVDYVREGDGFRAAGELDSELAKLAGEMLLDGDGRLIELDLDRAFLAGRADVAGEVRRGSGGDLAFSLRGPFLDVSNAIPDLGSLGDAGGMRTAVTVDAEVDRLALGDDLQLSGARLAAISTGEGLQSFVAAGRFGGTANMEASYRRAEDGSAELSIISDDAGQFVTALLDTDVLVGGRLELTGALRADGQPSDVQINIFESRLRDAPFLTQILSLASLRGLADTLGGDGVLFSEIELPLQMAGGRFVVRGGRASGPALGLTVNGWVEPEAGGISVDGVLVPSFGVNSALGGVPIIGDLFVGREGEGVFSLTYSVRGELSKAQVQVNPLSAITPGVLRRIFENPTDTELPLPQDPDDNTTPGE